MHREHVKFYFNNEFEIWREFGQSETEQDPMVLPPHVFCLPSVCGKTLAKE